MNTAQLIGVLLVGGGVVLSLTRSGAVIGIPLIFLGIGVVIIDGALGGAVNLGLLATGKHKEQAPDSNKSSGVIFEGSDREIIQPNSYTHYDFHVPSNNSGNAICELSLKSFSEHNINLILTTQSEKSQFEGKGDIQVLDKFTEYNIDQCDISGLIQPGDWSIILDNTGGIADVEGTKPVEIEMQCQIRR
jgi:hypothetical protein